MAKCTFHIFLFILLFPLGIRSQNIGVGADAIYNFQTSSYAAGLRVNFFPKKIISYVPEFSYYFPSNKITEYYAGVAVECKVIGNEKFNLYAIVHGGYNSWTNYESSALKGAHLNNWDMEGGGGISTSKCLRPFMEYRYNVKFRETHLRIGILYIFGCGNGRNIARCPAFG